MLEVDIWKWLKNCFTPDEHVQRIESLNSAGVPDVEGQIPGCQFWIELKRIHKGTLKFEVGQREWARRRWKAGGRSYILIVHDASREMFMVPGGLAMVLPLNGKADLALLRLLCSMRGLYKVTGDQRAFSMSANGGLWVRQVLNSLRDSLRVQVLLNTAVSEFKGVESLI